MIPISKPYIGAEEKQAVLEVLDSGMLVQGARTARLEERFAEVCGTGHAVAVASGTAALHMALLAHSIGPGDEVITTPFTFIASINSILYTGARPVFVDIDAETYNIDPSLIEAAITPRTKAIMPVHLYGYPCDMDRIMDLASRYHLTVIEDAAQAIGAEYAGRRAGSFGTGCFSLYATKNIMSGEGGMITTNDGDIAQKCRMLRNHGMQRRYYHDILGYNLRMTDLHAAIGLAQIERLEEFTARRRANAVYLNEHITNPRIITPQVREGYAHVWHQYTVRLNQPDADGGKHRDEAVQRLNAAGVGTGIFYPLPAYKQAYIGELGITPPCLPVTEHTTQTVFSLPVHPLLSESDLETIAQAVNSLE